MEEETEIMENLTTQARHLLAILKNESKADLIAHADEFLLFLNHLADTAKKAPQLASQIRSLNDIIKDLESNPDETICQQDVQARLRSFFTSILK